MSAVFVRPLPFTAAATSPTATAPVSNMANDLPGMVWRSGGTSAYFIIDLGTAASYDYVALIGANLRASDTVQIRTGTTDTGIGSYAGAAIVAFTGTKPAGTTTEAIFKLSATRTERYMRVDIAATGIPEGYIQAVRLVVGKSITTGGVSYDAEMSFVDRSVITSGTGYTSVDAYDVLTQWKVATDWISETAWRADWIPFFRATANSNGYLFIPDDTKPAQYQTDAIYGRTIVAPTGKNPAFNVWRFEATILQLLA
jgi:hypothetical protein